MERERSRVPSKIASLPRKWVEALCQSSGRTRTVAALVSILLGTAQALGFRMETQDALEISSRTGFAFAAVEITLASAIFGCVLLPLFHYSTRYEGLVEAPGLNVSRTSFRHRRLLFVSVLAAAWLLWWLFLWPGATTGDSFAQLIQALGLVGYSDAHPIAHTLVIQLLLRSALALTGNIYWAIAFVTLVQLVAMATAVGLATEALFRLSIPKWIPYSVLVLFAAHPLIGWYSVTLWKDIWLSTFLLVFGTVATIIAVRRNRSLEVSWQLWGMLLLAAVGAMLSKRTGVYIIIPSMLITAVFLKGLRLRWLAAGLISFMIYSGLHAVLIVALGVQPARETEAWSLPVQQIARVVKNYPTGLSPAQETTLEYFFPGEDIGMMYEPWKSNVVKDRLDPEALSADRPRLIGLWAELGREHPATYLDAFVAQTYGYWYPDTYYWMVPALDWTAMVNLEADRVPETEHLHEDVAESRVTGTSIREHVAAELNGNLRHIPIFGLLFSLGAWTWAAVVLAGVAVVRRQRIAAPMVALGGMVWAACMVSPVYAEARYAFPLLLLLPLLAAAVYLKHEEPDERDAGAGEAK